MDELRKYIQNELKELIFKTVDFDEPLMSTKVLDSILLVDLIVSIEEYTDITIPTGEVNEDNFETINKMNEYIVSLK